VASIYTDELPVSGANGVTFPTPFALQGVLSMKKTIAKFAKTVGAPVSMVAILALFPAGAHADLIFEHDGHTYKLVALPATWDEAAAAAKATALAGDPGYLARIDSAAENQAILEAVTSHLSPAQLANSIPNDGSEAAFVWLGGSDARREGQWTWSNNGDLFWQGDFNGAPVKGRFTNWGVQPDNLGGAENALAMGLANWPEPFNDLGAAGQWNDLEAGNKLVYIIEFDAVVEPLRAELEQPADQGVYTGVGMIRGWALSAEEVERIEVYIDGSYAFDVPYGDPRTDIGYIFSNIDGSSTSGFSVPFRYSELSAGEHTISVVVTDSFGNRLERNATFDVVRFEKPFLYKENTPNMNWALASSYADYITVRGVEVNGSAYSVTLRWQTMTQSFEIINIVKH
jgi:hypothetical protein